MGTNSEFITIYVTKIFQHLLEGHSSPVLLPKNILYHPIWQLIVLIKTKYSKFYLIHIIPQWYYKYATVQLVNFKALCTSAHFPVTSTAKPSKLFQIITISSSIVTGNKIHTSQLLNIPDRLIITEHQQYYLTLSDTGMNTCKLQELTMCALPKSLIPLTFCIMALFANEKNQVQKLCDFRFNPDTLPFQVREIDTQAIA